jgi:hypothetical protein
LIRGTPPASPQMNASNDPNSRATSITRRAFSTVDSIFARLRTMPSSFSRRSTSWGVKRATATGSNPANARR